MPFSVRRLAYALGLALMLAVSPPGARAQDAAATPDGAPPGDARFDLHFQLTTVTQYHPGFDAAYSGKNSLNPDAEHETTITSTLFLGARLWKGAEVYVNPELSGGSGLSHTFGVAGFPNGEAFRVGDAQPRIYLGRLMLRQTFAADPRPNPSRRTRTSPPARQPRVAVDPDCRKFGVGDFFDGNAYSHDPGPSS
jgi:high affinity Mn2+ porin